MSKLKQQAQIRRAFRWMLTFQIEIRPTVRFMLLLLEQMSNYYRLFLCHMYVKELSFFAMLSAEGFIFLSRTNLIFNHYCQRRLDRHVGLTR